MISYWGSKKKIARDIAEVLCAEGRAAYCEPFVGMASVGLEVLDCFEDVQWSDASPDVVRLLTAVQRGWLPSARPLSEAEWRSLREARPSAARSFYGFHFGWGGHFLAGRSLPSDKNTSKSLLRVRERLREASGRMRGVRIRCLPFWDVVPPLASVVYCDPPYVRSDGKAEARHFAPSDMARLWDVLEAWIRDRGCVVFLSASEVPTPPRGRLRLRVVRSWWVYNNTVSMNALAPRHRREHLLRVRLAESAMVPPSTRARHRRPSSAGARGRLR